uniref:Uncharacterized protein n=1 Tax=Chromera velia CCMP2878 TaxID=1169474 RepID=A0A0G4FEF9_9ALVE|mmetsp:Transcript_8430/g.16376  ORF Transcript_8430/g.16376 Transcript_8430/m.16376 type:complete len:220 (+) Transcript_8430:145-804(+)|eukprot:Cvel_16591.t1-p1 / transcript=Cvel_16591.t1 / gene=Cvel_16591 / organism=Chromera_velia_CCMP2878 / gene_product=hypothetical protein / transcript_product=hypothetical protein / location=Cvel_scaffold1285:4829-5485(-) / protein_length=219 / sequence_SO=supercontig / SO=protein_coding / is_pseudo=false
MEQYENPTVSVFFTEFQKHDPSCATQMQQLQKLYMEIGTFIEKNQLVLKEIPASRDQLKTQEDTVTRQTELIRQEVMSVNAAHKRVNEVIKDRSLESNIERHAIEQKAIFDRLKHTDSSSQPSFPSQTPHLLLHQMLGQLQQKARELDANLSELERAVTAMQNARDRGEPPAGDFAKIEQIIQLHYEQYRRLAVTMESLQRRNEQLKARASSTGGAFML